MSWREKLCGESQKRITVGFDGFVDTIVRPLRQADDTVPFATIRDFGEFLISKAEKSCSIELQTQARQLGGNLPFLSRAAGGLGLNVSCIGMLGQIGEIEPVFSEMPCKLYPFAPPGQSTCLEFQDGKVMLASSIVLQEDVWELVLAATEGRAPELFCTADLIALVNWSELPFSHSLWEHTLDTLKTAQADKTRYAFFDLCDVSRKTNAALHSVLVLIGAFSDYRTTVLSLNENEARIISENLLAGPKQLDETAKLLRTQYGIDEVIIHTIRESLLVTSRGTSRQPTAFVQQPKISTGAGDNFNGASCFAAVMGLDDMERIAFANAFAHFYVSEGRNPSLQELMEND